MTAQEIFDTVAVKLREQGGPSLSHRGGCAYRGRDGRRCAVGWLISDDEYSPDMEAREASILILPKRLHEHELLLLSLQNVHDAHEVEVVNWFDDVAVSLRDLANEFELSPAVLDS